MWLVSSEQSHLLIRENTFWKRTKEIASCFSHAQAPATDPWSYPPASRKTPFVSLVMSTLDYYLLAPSFDLLHSSTSPTLEDAGDIRSTRTVQFTHDLRKHVFMFCLATASGAC
jgi:hypothetical protein